MSVSQHSSGWADEPWGCAAIRLLERALYVRSWIPTIRIVLILVFVAAVLLAR